jgi:hypothetical protein
MRSLSEASTLVGTASSERARSAGLFGDRPLVWTAALVVAQAAAFAVPAGSGNIPPVVFSLFRALLTL